MKPSFWCRGVYLPANWLWKTHWYQVWIMFVVFPHGSGKIYVLIIAHKSGRFLIEFNDFKPFSNNHDILSSWISRPCSSVAPVLMASQPEAQVQYSRRFRLFMAASWTKSLVDFHIYIYQDIYIHIYIYQDIYIHIYIHINILIYIYMKIHQPLYSYSDFQGLSPPFRFWKWDFTRLHRVGWGSIPETTDRLGHLSQHNSGHT